MRPEGISCREYPHSRGQAVFSLPHIEGITLGAGEEVDEVAGGTGGMGVDGIGEVGD